MRRADIITILWIPFSLVFFTWLKPRHAVLVVFLGAWLFLPMKAGLKINMLPDIDKVTASTAGVLLGVMLFDPARLLGFRPKWFDIPMAAWCFTPFLSSLSNGLGAWDGMSVVLDQLAMFGIPYIIGRVYFNDWEGFRELAIAIFIGGLIYVPLCLIEIKMSPQLHVWVYGYHQHAFDQTLRMGGWRPMVFMQHGLAVGFWMTAASIIGVWLMVTGALKQVWGVPMIVVVPILLVTTILCKATASIGFLFIGIAVLFAMKWTKTAIPLYLLVAVAPVYMFVRASGTVDGTWLVEKATETLGEDRAESLAVRINAENTLSAHALDRPWFGWARWDPNNPGKPPWMVYDDETGRRLAIPDGMWIITFGVNGFSGVFWLTTSILIAPLLLRKRMGPQWWGHPMAAPAAACAVMLTLHMIDNLLNAMINPIFICAIGGLCALGTRVTQPAMQMPRGYPMMPRGGMQRPMGPAANANANAPRRPIAVPPPISMPRSTSAAR
jgi:hypothetical protein